MRSYFNSNPTLPNGVQVPLSGAVRSGDLVFISGQLGLDADWQLVEGGITEQTRQMLKNLEAQLAAAGARMDQVVKTSIWLTRKEDFAAFNKIYASAFGAQTPARSTVISELLIPGALVEMEAIASLAD